MYPAGCFLTPIHGVCALMKMPSAPLLQHICSKLLQPVLCSLMIMLLGTGFVVAAEIDDSSLFVEAFTAYQKKDYLLAIDTIGTIEQLFPDTPLRDVALLLLARSALKSGDNELAAKTIVQFNSEFPANPLKAGIEEELFRLGRRWQKGERLPPAIPLRTAARKVRNEQMDVESSRAKMIGQERLLAEKAGQDGMLEQAAAERRHSERLVPEKALPESARASISIPGDVQTVAVGQRGEIPFEIVNLGTVDEDFVLEASAPPGYEALVTVVGRPDATFLRVTIGTALPFKGRIMFRMPPDELDGHKAVISLRAVSEKYPLAVQTRDAQVITAAPLVRVVARPEKLMLAPGEQTRYHVTVLNAGSLPTLGLDVRVFLPAQIELMGGDGSGHRENGGGGILFKIDTLNSGTLADFTMDVRIREDSLIGQELRSQVEVVHTRLQIKELFTSSVAVIQAK